MSFLDNIRIILSIDFTLMEIDLKDKLVLVTGASGFIASHCIKELLKRGCRVRGTVRSVNSSFVKEFYEAFPDKK